jgi:hypothetical protein
MRNFSLVIALFSLLIVPARAQEPAGEHQHQHLDADAAGARSGPDKDRAAADLQAGDQQAGDQQAGDQQSDAPPADPHAAHQHGVTTTSRAWTLTGDANVFVGFNYQNRRYFDFAAWESQNWVMGTAARPVGQGHLMLHGMLSLEPLTIGRYVYRVDDGDRFDPGGSPQLFQTGESYNGLPLAGYQHPHDLFMGIGATYERQHGRLTYVAGADLVGSPTLGPTPFMHRESARDNPQVPLSHHLLDSTHSTPGVVRGGVRISEWTVEASAFRGQEPDENRYDIDAPRLDSWAARVGWNKGGWRAQVSGGHLHDPEWFSPYDQTRLTGSLEFAGTIWSKPATMAAAYGQVLEYTAYRPLSRGGLFEWDVRLARTLTTYGRAELVRKEVYGLHIHTPDMPPHPTFLSDVGAITFGAVKDLRMLGLDRLGRFGIGGDMTLYDMSMDLEPIYSGSTSFHVFLRWRPAVTSTPHVH